MNVRTLMTVVVFAGVGASVADAQSAADPVAAEQAGLAGEEAAVREVVETIFRGMRQADSTMVRSVFDTGARFAMISEDDGVQYAPVDGWIRAVGRSGGRWDERVYDVRVEVDLPIASVWAPYTFYLDGAVRHCGVNTIEMLRTTDGWRITQISDSRRMEGCPDPLSEQAGPSGS